MHTNFLIIGAGPFGLAMAAQARSLGVEHVVVGEPMSFWKRHMPAGMLLRSASDWHLDPLERDTIDRFLETRGLTPSEADPIPLQLYLEYAQWFAETKQIRVQRSHVSRLEKNNGRFTVVFDDGSVLTADRVLLALGFAPFAHVPDALAALIPPERSTHTRDVQSPAEFVGRRVVIVGGRQSAFETAALLAEAGAVAVHVCHRHDTPSFAESDWSFVGPLLKRMGEDPVWFRGLTQTEREEFSARFWREGRLKLEPWLGPRVRHRAITIRPHTRVVGSENSAQGLRVTLNSGDSVEVDHVMFATGYKADVCRIELLRGGNLLERVDRRDGFPVLDESLQSSVEGLHFTSLAATRDFGLFFAFTAAARASAKIIGRAL